MDKLNYQLISTDLQDKALAVISQIEVLDKSLKEYEEAVEDLQLDKQNSQNFISALADITDKAVTLTAGVVKTNAQLNIIFDDTAKKVELNKEEFNKWGFDNKMLTEQLEVIKKKYEILKQRNEG